ncbi:hypothetical protein MMC07_003602 [Pseudocyphellaria aurata]|nr:hypothetical protein [Pseudocyphellaria aurata]
MALFNVTLKTGSSPDELVKAKEKATSQGGVIKHEFTLYPGFTVEFPDDKINVLETDQHLNVEQDGVVTTQS